MPLLALSGGMARTETSIERYNNFMHQFVDLVGSVGKQTAKVVYTAMVTGHHITEFQLHKVIYVVVRIHCFILYKDV